MATIDIVFNDKTYSIEESAFEAAAAALRTHFLSAMSGSGATINLGGTTYNIDSTKLSVATTNLVTHLGKISGSGSKVTVGGVEYSFAPSKVQDAIADLEVVLGDLVSGGGNEGGSEDVILAEGTYNFIHAEVNGAGIRVTNPSIDGNVSNFVLDNGETYKVVWDGVEYTCVVATDNVGEPCMGNYALAGAGDDTGEPFFIIFDTGHPICIANDGAIKHLIGIYKVTGGNNGSGSIEGEVIIEENTYNEFFEAYTGVYTQWFDVELVVGETYRVVWDGLDYTMKALEAFEGGIFIGNSAILGYGDDNGYPFVIAYDEANYGQTVAATTEAGTSHHIGLYKISNGSGSDNLGEVVLAEMTYNGFSEVDGYDFYAPEDPDVFFIEFVEGETYRVIWDGVEYICTGYAQDELNGVGNASIVGYGDDTGEPFIISNNPFIRVATFDTASSHTIAIYKCNIYDDTFPIEWNAKELYENTSRARFAVTLDGQNLRFAKVSNLIISAEELNSMNVNMSLGEESMSIGCYGVQTGDGYVLGQFTPNLAEYGTMVGCVANIGDGSIFPETGIYAFYSNDYPSVNFSMQ